MGSKVTAKSAFVITLMMLLLGVISFLFWQEEYQYYGGFEPEQELPALGTPIPVDDFGITTTGKPKFIHFYNDDCKLSKINIEHLEYFMPDYKDRFDFYIMINGELDEQTLREKHQLPDFIKIMTNVEEDVFNTCGVYSTPQAVILDPDNTLYFRGNYNDSNGLCGALNISSSAPAIALSFKKENKPSPLFPGYQINGWGCRL